MGTRLPVRLVPRLVPVAVETAQQMRNVAATKPPPDTPTSRASRTRASTRPPALMSDPNTPASIHAMTMSMTIF